MPIHSRPFGQWQLRRDLHCSLTIRRQKAMPKVHTHLQSIDTPSFDLLQRELFDAAEYPGTDDNGWLLGTLDEVQDLMALSLRSGLAVRFRGRGIPIITAWHWLGAGVGVAHMIVGGKVGQVHLMLAGIEAEDRA